MSAITVNGDVIHYEVLGRGRQVVLVHGWLGSWRYWVPTLQQLQAKYRVYALDLFGYGDSGKNPRKYPLEQQIELLVDFTRELGIPKAALIGHGLGAVVCAEYARRFPDAVARMMLISLPLFDTGDLDRRVPIARKMTGPLKRVAAEVEESKPEPGPLSPGITRPGSAMRAALQETARIRSADVARSASTSTAEDAAEVPTNNPLTGLLTDLDAMLSKAFRRSDPEYGKLRVDLVRTDPRVLPRSISTFDAGHMLDTLRLLTMPAVVLHGADDPIIPPPSDAVWNYVTFDKENTLVPVPLPGIRHFPMLEYDRFARLATEFLEVPDISRLEIKGRWHRRTR